MFENRWGEQNRGDNTLVWWFHEKDTWRYWNLSGLGFGWSAEAATYWGQRGLSRVWGFESWDFPVNGLVFWPSQIVVGCKLQCFYFPLSLCILCEGSHSNRRGTQFAETWERQREWRHVSSEKLFSWLCHGFIKFILPHVHAVMKSMISCSALLG